MPCTEDQPLLFDLMNEDLAGLQNISSPLAVTSPDLRKLLSYLHEDLHTEFAETSCCLDRG
jgi:hypothetical protein